MYEVSFKDFNEIKKEELFAINAKEAMYYLMKNHCVFINSNYQIEIGKFNKTLQELRIDYVLKDNNGYDMYTIGDYKWFNENPVLENVYNVSLDKVIDKIKDIQNDSYNDFIIPVDKNGNVSNSIYKNFISILRESKKNNLKFKRLDNYDYKGNKTISAIVTSKHKIDNQYYGIAFLDSNLNNNQILGLKNAVLDDNLNIEFEDHNYTLLCDTLHDIVLFSYDKESHKVTNYVFFLKYMLKDAYPNNEDLYILELSGLSGPTIRLYKNQEIEDNINNELRKLDESFNKVEPEESVTFETKKIKVYNKETDKLLLFIEFVPKQLFIHGNFYKVYVPVSHLDLFETIVNQDQRDILEKINHTIYKDFIKSITDNIDEYNDNHEESFNFIDKLVYEEIDKVEGFYTETSTHQSYI